MIIQLILKETGGDEGFESQFAVCTADAVRLSRSAIHPAAACRPNRLDGVFFHAQADRGEVDFSKHCSRCHDGSGEGLILSSEEFFNRWREERLSALFNYIKITMPADNPGSLSEREYLDTLIYILQINFYPAGDTDILPPQLDGVLLVGAEGPSRCRPARWFIPSVA